MANKEQKQYEITYLIDPELSEDERGELSNAVDAQIAELGGAVQHAAPTARQKLAYEIEDKRTAHIRKADITMPPDGAPQLRDYMRKTDGILRSIVVDTPPRTEAREVLEQRNKEKQRREEQQTQSDKEVTMEQVEEGIEEALSEEVK